MPAKVKIVVVGAGGLGIPALWGLISQWPQGKSLDILLLDPDHVELSNLNRQVLYLQSDIGRPKLEVIEERLAYWLPALKSSEVNLQGEAAALSAATADRLLAGASLVIDACDCSRTKFLINDYCVKNRIAFCYGGVAGRTGQLLFYQPSEHQNSACLRCLFGNFEESDFQTAGETCSQAGVLGPVAGLLGLLQAEYSLKYCLGQLKADSGSSTMLRFDLENMQPKKIQVPASADCPLDCAKRNQSQKKSSRTPRLDLKEIKCPMTLVYTKAALEDIGLREKLIVEFADKYSAENVANSLKIEGQTISDVVQDGSRWKIFIEKRR